MTISTRDDERRATPEFRARLTLDNWLAIVAIVIGQLGAILAFGWQLSVKVQIHERDIQMLDREVESLRAKLGDARSTGGTLPR